MSAALGAIVAAFALLLAIKAATRWRFCVLCGSIGGTWLVLLVLYHAGRFDAPLLLALLMGQTITGIYYLLETRVREAWLVFRLPFVLTLIPVFYALLTLEAPPGIAAIGLAVLWLAAIAIYACRNAGGVAALAHQLIECCKNW